MNTLWKNRFILMADDDIDDYYLVRDAFERTSFPADLRLVSDGDELMDYLQKRGQFEDTGDDSLPAMIFLDLNMPRKDGWEVLSEIKAIESFRQIPVIIFSTSSEEEDVLRSYELGASSYIRKPSTFEALMSIIEMIGRYWTGIVKLPPFQTMGKGGENEVGEWDE